MRISRILAVGLVIGFSAAAASLAQIWFERQASLTSRGPDTIVVAVQPLRFGTELKAEHLREITWPAGPTPSGSFKKISDLLTVEGRRVVLSPIEPSEPVLSWKVTGPGERALSAVVEGGMRAMSVRINDVNRVAGFVLPGDRVDIMLTRSNITDILLRNVRILAIGQSADERQDKPKSDTTATLEVNTVDAQKLTLAQTVGTLSLVLRAAGPLEPPAKRIEEGFRAMERRIEEINEEFSRKARAVETRAIWFDPNARGDFPNPDRCDFPYGPCHGMAWTRWTDIAPLPGLTRSQPTAL